MWPWTEVKPVRRILFAVLIAALLLGGCAKKGEPSELVPKQRVLDVVEILEKI